MNPPRMRRIAWLAALAWVTLLFTLSTLPLGDGALEFRWRFAHDDKLAHAGLYAVLGVLVRWASGRRRWAVAAGAGVGTVDELIQSTVPGRHADPLDVLADVVGAAIGAAVIAPLLLTIARRRREARDRVAR